MELHTSALAFNGGPRTSGGRSSSRPRATRSLVLWSGGVASTYTLLRVLLETDDDVITHHLQVSDGSDVTPCARRGLFERGAIAALRPCLAARARAFEHTEASLVARSSDGGIDAALVAFMGARVALASSFTPFDRMLIGVDADRDPGWHPDSAACALRRMRLARAIRGAFGADEVPQVYLWEPRPTHAQMLDCLGDELAALTVSCLRPATATDGSAAAVGPCGECRKCRGETVLPAAWAGPESRAAGPLNRDRASAPAERTPPPFRHLVASRSRTRAPGDAAAASDRPGP